MKTKLDRLYESVVLKEKTFELSTDGIDKIYYIARDEKDAINQFKKDFNNKQPKYVIYYDSKDRKDLIESVCKENRNINYKDVGENTHIFVDGKKRGWYGKTIDGSEYMLTLDILSRVKKFKTENGLKSFVQKEFEKYIDVRDAIYGKKESLSPLDRLYESVMSEKLLKLKKIGKNSDGEMMYEDQDGIRWTELELKINKKKYRIESLSESFKFKSPYDIQKFLKSNKNFSKEWSVEDMAAFTKQDVKDVKRLAQNAYAQNLINYNNGKYSSLKESLSAESVALGKLTQKAPNQVGNWKKQKTTFGIIYENEINGKELSIYDEQKIVSPYLDMFYVSYGQGKKWFKTGEEALKFAIDYMNKNKESFSLKEAYKNEDYMKQLQKDIETKLRFPYVKGSISTLGGEASYLFSVSRDEKRNWEQGYIENSDYAKFAIDEPGVCEMISGSLRPAMRKTRFNTNDDLIRKLDSYIKSAKSFWKKESFSKLDVLRERVLEGGPGSGIKGHKTAEEPTQTKPRTKKVDDLPKKSKVKKVADDGFVRNKIHTPQEATVKYHNPEEVKKTIEASKGKLKPQDRQAITDALDKVEKGEDTLGQYSKNGKFTPERQKLHNQIIDKFLTNAKPSENPEIIFLGGVAGSGKSSVVAKAIKDPENYVTIDADEIKKMLPEYKDGGAGGAILTHEESSYLTKQILKAAEEKGANILLDGTLNNLKKYKKLTNIFGKKGYKTKLFATQLPTHKSIERAMARYEHTGRYVPPHLIDKMGQNINSNIHTLKHDVDDYMVFDNDVEMGKEPIRLERYN